jgi:hypothetical protein
MDQIALFISQNKPDIDVSDAYTDAVGAEVTVAASNQLAHQEGLQLAPSFRRHAPCS